ncbi:MAG: hypothetical protein WB763_16855 [Terriglobia bacterium]|jgi:hypothetical protein
MTKHWRDKSEEAAHSHRETALERLRHAKRGQDGAKNWFLLIAQARLLIPMKVGTDSGLIPGSDSDVIPGVFGAKRRWPSYRA